MKSTPCSQQNTWPTTQVTLLRRVADQGDKNSWDCFVHTYGPLVHRYCVRRGMQAADAMDVVQDVLLQVSKSIGEFHYDADRGQFRNWLGTVTHRAMLKHQAKARRWGGGFAVALNEPSSAQESGQWFDELWVENFNAHVYREAIGRIRADFRDETWRAFEATFSEDQPPHQVADELRRTVGWVYQAKSQVIRRLKKEILYLAEDSVLFNLPAKQ